MSFVKKLKCLSRTGVEIYGNTAERLFYSEFILQFEKKELTLHIVFAKCSIK